MVPVRGVMEGGYYCTCLKGVRVVMGGVLRYLARRSWGGGATVVPGKRDLEGVMWGTTLPGCVGLKE